MIKEQKNEIFIDRLFYHRPFTALQPIYLKHREGYLYLFFGGLAFFLNVFLFLAIDQLTDINEIINNTICWIICVLFQFITNKYWVFEAKDNSSKKVVYELSLFAGGRIFTLIVEDIILEVFINQLHYNTAAVKIIAQIVVIILNYLISKMIVFKKTNSKSV